MTQSLEAFSAAVADRYRIERELGAGAMASVYLAHDLRHQRKVALKIPHGHLSERVGVDRFLNEIRTTAQLQHPHILPLYDSGTAAGALFYVMPFMEGESLRDKIDREGAMPIDDATRLICEIADALTYAHRQGIIHRDIKPDNIMLANGHALLSDFGIALAITAMRDEGHKSITDITGTAAYMSPEQAAGEQVVDERSDVYSLGCVFFEMLTGKPPFTGATDQAVMAQRFAEPAPSARALRPKVSHRVDAAVRTAMAIEPMERFSSAARFADAISSAATTEDRDAGAHRSIAVLPFKNLSNDPEAEFFSDGITEDLLNALVRLPGLRVIARTSSFAFKGMDVDVREIAEQLGVATILEGSVRRAGNRLRLTAQLVNAKEGHQLWSERYDREMEDVFAVQDEITEAIRDALSEKLLGLGRAQEQAQVSIDPDTYELFLRGRFFVAKRADGMQRGMELLGEVVARAPMYAPAYAELASAFSILTHYLAVPPRLGWSKVRELAGAALQLNPSLARAHAELGNVAVWHDWDWDQAKAHFERALALDPNDAWVNMCVSMYFSSYGRHDDAIEYCQRARSFDPLNPTLTTSLALVQYVARRHEQAIATAESILDQDPTYSDAHRIKGSALRELGRHEAAVEPTEASVLYSGSHPFTVSLRGILHAAAGREEEARSVGEELVARNKTSMEPPLAAPITIALLYAQIPDLDQTFFWLDQAFAARDPWVVMLDIEPAFDGIKHDPRFAALLDRIGKPHAQP